MRRGRSDEGDDVVDDDRNLLDAVCDAVAELGREGPGDVLVFLSGEREIRDCADALADRALRDTEVLPLYARLSAAEEHRVFERDRGRSRGVGDPWPRPRSPYPACATWSTAAPPGYPAAATD